MDGLDAVKTKSLAAIVRERLEEMIGQGTIQPGTRLSEQAVVAAPSSPDRAAKAT